MAGGPTNRGPNRAVMEAMLRPGGLRVASRPGFGIYLGEAGERLHQAHQSIHSK